MNVRSVVKKLVPRDLFMTIEPIGHLGEAILLNTLHGYPARGLKVIGVTGTNGKTTTTFMIHRMLHEAGYKVGMISTVAYGVGDDIKPQMTHMTSPTVPVLIERVESMRKQGIEWLVLETTSMALAQHRVYGIPYSVAVFTNLTHEHLAYHKTFERYRAAKVRMFTMANRNKKGLRFGVVNADDPNTPYFAKAIASSVSYGINDGDVCATDIVLTKDKVSFNTIVEGVEYAITCNIPGTFNVSNSLAALCVGHKLGLTKEQIERGIAALPGVEGRMTAVNEGQSFGVIVDYAHTPDSFEKLFHDLKPMVQGKLIVLFGSLGGGDTEKRPLQGELAGTYADEVIICEEDDRHEKPENIMNAIAAGVTKAGKEQGKNLFLEHDRTKAIQLAFAHARAGDMVLLLGKGHEKTIERADGEHPWNEIEIARQQLRELSA
jgi:UDP-N-acetylmuramoyl-L-alanyl-D-glutamate--2,6-diaminopimelate ligase